MNIFLTKVVAKGKSTKSSLDVNFFVGSENDKLVYRVDSGGWKNMERVIEADLLRTSKYMESPFE